MSESLTVDHTLDGKTLAAVVRHVLDVPWSRARALCSSGRVELDGKPQLDPATRVPLGANVRVDPGAPRLRVRGLGNEAIVHHDVDVVVVRKPAGIVSVPFEPGERDTLVQLAKTTVRRIERSRRPPTLRVVQRLDRETSGLLVFARNRKAERELQRQLRSHTVERRYVALAHGEVHKVRHDSMLIRDRGDGLRGSWGARSQHRGPTPETAKRAVTHVEPIEVLRGVTLVSCMLETGRQHQIRIHLSESGHPLVGESVYIRDFTGDPIEAPRCMLHAQVLGFMHPRTGRRVRFEDPPPEDFTDLLARLRTGAR